MKKIAFPLILILIFCLPTGCGVKGSTSFVKEDIPLDFMKTVAVLPLENNSDMKYAPELVRDIMNTHILAMELFDVVDKGIVDSVGYEEGILKKIPMDQQKLKRVGQRLNVQGLMLGTIDLAGDKRSGSMVVPEMGLTLRLIDVASGKILWQASGHQDGDSMVARLFGLQAADSYQVTTKLVRTLLYTIPEKAN